MLKGDSLRAAIVAALPDYGRDPDRLVIFASKGRIASRFAPPNLNFEYRYDLKVTLLDFAGHVDQLILPVLRWISVNQPELLQGRATANEAIGFEAEIIDATTKDLELTLALTEAVTVTERPDGGIDFQHLGAPPALNVPLAENAVFAELAEAGLIAP